MIMNNEELQSLLSVSKKIKALYTIRIDFSPLLSVNQVIFLIYSFTLGLDAFKPLHFDKLQYKDNLLQYYFVRLIDKEYLIRIDFGKYQHTDKAKALYAAFLQKLDETDLTPLFPQK